MDEIMSLVGTKRDGKIFPKQDSDQTDLISEFAGDISAAFDSGATAVYLEAVYDKYQQLADNLQIYNQDALTSLLQDQFYGKYRYIQRSSCWTTYGRDENVQEDLLRIMKTFLQPQNYAAIHKQAWYIPYEQMKRILQSTASIVNVAEETYFYAPNLPVSSEELAHLSVLMNEELSSRSYITDKQLKRLIEEKCPSIAINTDGYTSYGLRNCFKYILRDQFSFNGLIITRKDRVLCTADIFAEFAKDHEKLLLEDLLQLSEELNTGVHWDSVFSEMVRISDEEFVRKDQISFDTAAIDEVLEEICPGDYAPLSEMNLFLHFPNVGYSWNQYLLESYLFSYSRKFCLQHYSFAQQGVYGAMVRKSAHIPDYRALLVEVLSQSKVLNSSQEALQYLVDKGYQKRKRYKDIELVIQDAKRIKEQREKQER